MRFVWKLIFCFLLALAAGFSYLAVRSGDALYSSYEWLSPARFHQYDAIINAVAIQHRLDPQKHGTAGERGLMQVSAKAAGEWARENKVGNFKPDDLFDPKTNLEAG